MVEYRKFIHKKYGKLYAAVLLRSAGAGGSRAINGEAFRAKAARLTHRYFRTASQAMDYGRRVEARYERMCASRKASKK